MIDYLCKYLTDQGFDLPQLLHDDFFLAIRVTFNAGYYISATKLLVSFIDTVGYLESGDAGGNPFRGWLDKYVDMHSLGITSEELWEHRNSLLHMSTFDSRKVSRGNVRRLVAYIGQLPPGSPSEDKEAKWFSLFSLLEAVAQGISRYIQSMTQNPDRLATFLERYDQILSDSRIQRLEPQGDRTTGTKL